MSKKFTPLQQIRRRLRAVRLPLPTELFTFPLGLALSLVCPPSLAWGAVATVLALCVALMRALGWLSTNRSVVGRSLFVLFVWGGLLLFFCDLYPHALWHQALLLSSYLISSLAVALYRRVARPAGSTERCECVRGRILRVERLRFERILVVPACSALYPPQYRPLPRTLVLCPLCVLHPHRSLHLGGLSPRDAAPHLGQ